VLVSDHGATPAGTPLSLRRILAGAGLLTAEDRGGRDLADIDWQHTLAAPQGSCFVRLNLKGREPQGIVAPEAFEEVRARVLRALLDYRVPATGRCPFSLVIPKEDAVGLGLYGDGVGDVVYAVHPEYCEEHGQMLPQTTTGPGAWGMPALCLFSGAGIRAGGVVTDPASLTDVAPTICDALGIAPPLQADGDSLSRLFAGRTSAAKGGTPRRR
jgi:predicted AlkP superfamily phosphohydrolase/phosphomutase